MALLGDPSAGPGLPPEQVPAGSGWIEQVISVPATGAPRLTFSYRIVTYDVWRGGARPLWDTFDVTVGEDLVFRDGNEEPDSQGVRHDLGWRPGEVDLTPYRGEVVRLRFANWNRTYEAGGMDFYNTWTYLDQVEVKP